MQIKLLDSLLMNQNGILVNTKNDPIHLRQGDMDGACGPYCVTMALLVIERIARVDILPLAEIDYRTKAGKLLREIHNLDPLVLCGSDSNDLQNILRTDKNILVTSLESTGRHLIPMIKGSLDLNSPVILDVHAKAADGLHHWVLAIGYSDEHLFLLDPAYGLEPSNYWNSVISTKAYSTQFPYYYANKLSGYQVKLNNIISISSR